MIRARQHRVLPILGAVAVGLFLSMMVSFTTAGVAHAEAIPSWSQTTSYPSLDYGSGIAAESCATSGGYIYCVGGDSENAWTNGTEYAALGASGGVGAWNAGTPYPPALYIDNGLTGVAGIGEQSCVISGDYIYCVGGFDGDGTVADNYYASVSSTGFGTWTPTSGYWDVNSESCVTYSGYIYCVGGDEFTPPPAGSPPGTQGTGGTWDAVYYAPLTSSGIGTWTDSTNTYPVTIQNESCAVSGGYIYCVGGYGSPTSAVYYAQLSPTGGFLSGWTATTAYPPNTGYGIAGESCVISSGYLSAYIYCMGGSNGPYIDGETYYATVSSSGVGAWTATASYSPFTDLSCASSGIYIYCVGGENEYYAVDNYVFWAEEQYATLGVTCSPTTISAGAFSTCTATLTGYTGSNLQLDGETITWSQVGGTGAASFPYGTTCTLEYVFSMSCALDVQGAEAGSVTIQGSYPGDSNNPPSSATGAITVEAASTTTTATCYYEVQLGSTITCTAKVTGSSGSISGDTVTWTQTGGPGVASFPSGNVCTISGLSCSVALEGTGVGFATIQAAFSGDSSDLASTGTGGTTVLAATTTTSGYCSPPSFAVGATSSCTATISGFYGSTAGDIVNFFQDGGTGSISFPSGTECTLTAGGTCSSPVVVDGVADGSVNVYADYFGDSNNLGSNDIFTINVIATTATSASCSPSSFDLGTTSSCTATVTGFTGSITGETVAFSQSGAGRVAFPSGTTCSLSGGTCTVTIRGATEGSVSIQASYPGDADNGASSGSAGVTVNARTTSTGVTCTPGSTPVNAPTSCTVTVRDTDAGTAITPSGTVTMGSSLPGSFSGSCSLSGSGAKSTCQVTYAPSPGSEGANTITASYPGDSSHSASSGTLALADTVRSTATSVSCSPSSVPVNAPATCTATVTDTSAGTAITPSGPVDFTSSVAGTFSPSSCTPSGSGATASCSVAYTPGATSTGTNKIKAAFGGDTDHSASSGTSKVTATVRSTTTTLSCAAPHKKGVAAKCTATVTDTSPGTAVTPTGTVTFSTPGAGSFSSATCTLSGSGASTSCVVKFTPSSTGAYKITAAYGGDPAHGKSSGSESFTVT